jgi:hypothetical protein
MENSTEIEDIDPVQAMRDRAAANAADSAAFLARLRSADPCFAKASVLDDDNANEWQAAVYLLTGCPPVWDAFGPEVMAERSLGPVLQEVEERRRRWSGSAAEVLRWSAHFWDMRPDVQFPYRFDRFLFRRWVLAVHLRKNFAPEISFESAESVERPPRAPGE